MHLAICGELGAGCTEVGQILSESLGLRCVSSSEVVRSLVSDYSESFEDFESHVRSGEVHLDRMIDGKLDDILESGVTIVEGRSGFMLFDNEDVFRVLLIASREERVGKVSAKREISRKI